MQAADVYIWHLHGVTAPAYQGEVTEYKKTFSLESERATQAFGATLAAYVKQGDIIALRGDLGAGKTSLARGLIGALCGAEEVPSPTYTLVQTYDAPEFGIWHFDLYRLDDPGDVWELGIEEALDDGVCLIEWPERIENLLSGAELNIEIGFDGEGRTARVTGNKQWGSRLEQL